MSPLSRTLLNVLRVAVAVQLILGITLWTGALYTSLVGVHQTVGTIFVLTLWVLAVATLLQRRAVGVALFAILWGFVIAMFGFMQRGMLPGEYHWVIRVLHLLVGVAAMPIAERLARGQRVATVAA